MAASRTDQRCNANALTSGTVRTCVEARLHGSYSARREASPPSLLVAQFGPVMTNDVSIIGAQLFGLYAQRQ
jgi:hypothetical protein